MSHFFPAHDQAIMSLLSILQKDRERCCFSAHKQMLYIIWFFQVTLSSPPEKVCLKCTFPRHTHIPTALTSPGKGARAWLSLTQTVSVSLWLTRGKKRLFDNGAPKGINRALLFIDPRLDSLITRCSLHFRPCVTSIYSCPGFGFSAPLIFPALYISDALPLERWQVLAGTMECNVCVDKMITLKLLFSLPQGQLCPLVLSLMFELEETKRRPGLPDLLIN